MSPSKGHFSFPELTSHCMFSNMDGTFQKTSRCYIPKRYILVMLGFIGMFNSYAMRVNLSVAMVAMVNISSRDAANYSVYSSECPAQDNTLPQEQTHFKGDSYNWDPKMQGWVMSSFFYGYVITGILGGYVAERFSAVRVFGGGLFLTGIHTLITPVATAWGVAPLMVVRAMEGLGEGVTFPSMTAIISCWSPKLERSRIASVIFSGTYIGNVIAMSASGWLCENDFLGGWPAVFYIFGFICCVWFLFWCFFIYESPYTHPSISQEELALFLDNEKKGKQKKFVVPWRCIFTSVPFWVVVASNFGFLFGQFMFLTQLPTYISTVHHFDLRTVGMMSAIPYITVCIGAWISSYIADKLRSSGTLAITTIRKLFNSIGGYGPCVCVLAITLSGCRPYLNVALFSLALFLNGATSSGYTIALVDMSPDFAGTLLGLTNGFGSLSGVIGPAMVGYFTENGYTIANWNKGFYVTALIYFATTTLFAIFGSAEVQPWGVAVGTTKELRLLEKVDEKEKSKLSRE